MAIGSSKSNHSRVVKRTCQGGSQPKTSAMNKTTKRAFKAYRGQGK